LNGGISAPPNRGWGRFEPSTALRMGCYLTRVRLVRGPWLPAVSITAETTASNPEKSPKRSKFPSARVAVFVGGHISITMTVAHVL
jgi:hypothetical protein